MKRLEQGCAIVLESKLTGEADNLVTVLLEDGQLLRLIMHGLRASRKRNKRLAEPGTIIDIVYYPHDSGPASMKEGNVLESFDDLKQGYRNLEWLAFVLELSKMGAQQDCGPALYLLLEGMLTNMQQIAGSRKNVIEATDDVLIIHFFMARLLQLLGLLGDPAHCAACGQELNEKASWIKPEVFFYCDECSLEATAIDYWMSRLLGYIMSNRFNTVAAAFARDRQNYQKKVLVQSESRVDPQLALLKMGYNLRDALLHTHGRAFQSMPEGLQADVLPP